MDIRKYTTPTYVLTIDGIDLSEANVVVTLKQGENVLSYSPTATFEDDVTTIEIHMTQEESGLFSEDDLVQLQVNWTANGERNATDIVYIRPRRNLVGEVME